MRKNKKYKLSFAIIILSLMFSSIVYAEEISNNLREGRDGFMIREREGLDINKEDKLQHEEVKENLKNQKEEKQIQIKERIKNIKERREEFRNQLEIKKEEIKSKIAEARARFKENLEKIKDEKKKNSTEKIFETIQSLNTKLTDHFYNQIEQIENVLVGIESRMSKAEEQGLDVSSVKSKVEKTKNDISVARDAISKQSNKIYEVNITDEITLKNVMSDLRKTFTADIKVVREKIKIAHMSVKDIATSLAQIPKIDEIETEVENDDNSNIN